MVEKQTKDRGFSNGQWQRASVTFAYCAGPSLVTITFLFTRRRGEVAWLSRSEFGVTGLLDRAGLLNRTGLLD